jgi:hypothetical protein
MRYGSTMECDCCGKISSSPRKRCTICGRLACRSCVTTPSKDTRRPICAICGGEGGKPNLLEQRIDFRAEQHPELKFDAKEHFEDY